MASLAKHLATLAVEGGTPVHFTLLSREQAHEWIKKHLRPQPVEHPMTVFEFFFGADFADEPEDDKAPKPQKTRKTRKPSDKHVSRGPDAFRGKKVNDERGNRTGAKVRRKLSDLQVREIRWLCENTSMPNKDIGLRYGVGRSAVSHVRRSIRWSSVPGVVQPGWWVAG